MITYYLQILLRFWILISVILLTHHPVVSYSHSGVYESSGQEAELIFSEDFSGHDQMLPENWQSEGTSFPWNIHQSSFAGGKSPELQLPWYPSQRGTGSLISPEIALDNYSNLRLRVRQALHDFHIYNNEVAAIDIIYLPSRTRQTLWEFDVSHDLEAKLYEFYLDLPQGSTGLRIAFRFQGDNYNLWNWSVDDIVLENVPENDLEAIAVSGNNAPSVHTEEIFTVSIRNAGMLKQESYTVKLMHSDGSVLDARRGVSVMSRDTLYYDFAWAPGENDIGSMSVYGKIEWDTHEREDKITPPLHLMVQPENIVNFMIISGKSRSALPVNFLWKNSLTQSIYPARNIPVASGLLTGIRLSGFFENDLRDKTLSVWVGETADDDLKEGWADFSGLVKVFHSSMDFPQGENDIYVRFQEYYQYNGGNLLLMVHREDDRWETGSYFFTREIPGSGLSRRTQSDEAQIDPVAPADDGVLADEVAAMTMFFARDNLVIREPADEEEPKELPQELQELFARAIAEAEAAQIEQQQTPQQPPQQQQQARASTSDGIDITEFIFNETITKLGADFYYYFFQEWRNPSDIEGLSIYVQERPVPGMGGIIMVKVEDQMVFQSMLRPNNQQIREAASAAVQRARGYFINYEQIQQQLDGDDYRGTGIF